MAFHLITRSQALSLTTALSVTLQACERPRDSGSTAADTTPTPAASASGRPGIRFDPATPRPGDQLGELVVDSIDATITPIDSTYVGVAKFRNEIELSGWTLRHFDADLRDTASCFEADSASASRLPRWSGDERRPWFCFENAADAHRALGPPTDSARATIRIDEFTIHRGMSDQVNSARFVRLIARR